MPRWKAWLVIGAMGLVGGLLLWFGLVIVVRCQRVEGSRVDAAVERRFLGLLTVSRETVTDVVKADVYVVSGRDTSGGSRRRGSTEALELTSRDGVVLRRTRFGPAFGTQPSDMVDEITELLDDSTKSSLTTWWMPWLVNVGALPFVLIVGALGGELLLRFLGVLAPTASPRRRVRDR